MKYAIFAVLLFSLLVLFGCTQGEGNANDFMNKNQQLPLNNFSGDTGGAGLANPASVYCEQQGGELEIQETAAGQVGYCVFDDGRICEEWAFYRNQGDECISPEEMGNSEFCGTSTYGACEDDSECIEGGCSSQVCMSEAEGDAGGVTTCEWSECYNPEPYGLECGCIDGECQWA